MPGYEATVVGPDMQPLPAGEVGRLAVRGPTGCRYLADPRQTEYVVDGWNLTGDAFRMDEDGYFWFEARNDDLIVSSGYNISPFEVETALLEHDAVAECAVVASPDEARGHVVKAFVVLAEGVAGDDALVERAADARQGADRAVQVPAPGRVPRRAAADPDRQGAAQRAAQAGGLMRALQPPGWPRPRGYAQRHRGERPARVRRRPDRLGRETAPSPRPTSPARSARRSRTSSRCWPRPAPAPSTSCG